MQIYKRILVAIDCSPVDEAILAHVADLAVQNNAQVDLFHVVHSHTADQHRVLHEKAEKALESSRLEMAARGVDARPVMRSGEPEEEIIAQINSEDYDLVAMATHGHSFFGDLLFGSVSRSLKHKIDVPLLLIRSKGRENRGENRLPE